MKVAEQIRTEDPEAYEYLQGTKGMERIGAGFIAMVSALTFALFDLTASLLVLLGFLIFRWAVIAAPILGTVALLRPASGGLRRLVNAVVAALFNIVIFGTGAAIYLYAVDLIMNTTAIPGWLQVVLVLLCGVVGWMLLRPYRRITQLGGKDPLAAIAAGGIFSRRQAQLEQSVAAVAAAARHDAGVVPPVRPDAPAVRVELRGEPPLEITGTQPGLNPPPPRMPPRSTPTPRRPMPVPAPHADRWSEAGEGDRSHALYRPGRSALTTSDSGEVRNRVEARAEP